MKLEYENLQATVKRKFVFKYKPEFSESFRTDIKESQIIPLVMEVFKELEWPIVYQDEQSVEAKRQGDMNKLTEKVTITKKSGGLMEVHSKSLEGRFTDFGKNSKRTGLFIALFTQLATAYSETEQLEQLETEYDKQHRWTDYEVPNELPPPKAEKKPNLVLTIAAGWIIAVLFGWLFAYLSVKIVYFIGLYEVGAGIGMGYAFNQVLKKTRYLDFGPIKLMIASMCGIMFLTNHFQQYQFFTNENYLSNLGFFEFIRAKLEAGYMLEELNTGWIGFVVVWLLQLIIPYAIALSKVAVGTAKQIIAKIPEPVLEYTIYLLEMRKTQSEVRAHLAQKGWSKKGDQDAIFVALAEISGWQEIQRE